MRATALQIIGCALIVIAGGMWWLPLGVALAGVAVLVSGVALELAKLRHEAAKRAGGPTVATDR